MPYNHCTYIINHLVCRLFSGKFAIISIKWKIYSLQIAAIRYNIRFKLDKDRHKYLFQEQLSWKKAFIPNMRKPKWNAVAATSLPLVRPRIISMWKSVRSATRSIPANRSLSIPPVELTNSKRNIAAITASTRISSCLNINNHAGLPAYSQVRNSVIFLCLL